MTNEPELASGVAGYLLDDDQVADFVANGYHIVEPAFPP
jgi:hypothetical protein